MITINYIEIEQPIGIFYMCSIEATDLLKIVNVIPRTLNNNGVQRNISTERIKAVGEYCSDPDAVFPTPIVVSIDDSADIIIDQSNHTMQIPTDRIIGEVIDGQHRLWGIEKSNYIDRFNLPVVLMFNLSTEEKAYIFSTINSNQTKVNPSLIYDLYDIAGKRSPYKTVHHIARSMNYSPNSPFYNRLKMLGKKESSQENATLSQGTFGKGILKLITKDADRDTRIIKRKEKLTPDASLCFREYFIGNKDDVINKILYNCFEALRIVFPKEWDNPKDNILWKTTGFNAIIYAFPTLFKKGIQEKKLTLDFFQTNFELFKNNLEGKGISLTSKDFPGGGEQNQKKLAELIIESIS